MASILGPGQRLRINEQLVSGNGRYFLLMQSDGNLVLYRTENHHALWATNTRGRDVMHASMQTDGNFVLYNFAGRAVWASNTAGRRNSYLIMQNDGNLVIYQPDVPVWASGTHQPAVAASLAEAKVKSDVDGKGVLNPFGDSDATGLVVVD